MLDKHLLLLIRYDLYADWTFHAVCQYRCSIILSVPELISTGSVSLATDPVNLLAVLACALVAMPLTTKPQYAPRATARRSFPV